MTWRNFVGLPHETGSDPRNGKAADCLLVAMAVREELGLYAPSIPNEIFDMARQERWGELLIEFQSRTRRCSRHDGAMSIQASSATHEISIGVSVEKGLLLTSIRRGVIWLPNGLSRLSSGQRWFEPIQP